ncbi:type 1 glutamine amidotransferase [Pseudobacteriovorax antillogorgiicola]|uniref:Glutamine amidotransferase class-I n=1 Tax=Pseudobacteriovorax antillogorgiicola TaxID=1513793 RepID=A0A1Y6CV02_9BACT|nr:gamma-glutamyl-gamma-aminobutyrate hydrolase family protein [Pseudobacteriovorax antillogorgiicola]TCS44424.1 glutamine amidotransferase class I [Pseudobacteriovorax antillogorgiicola]SMF79044.1 Glutamine amidotransferase class-I [Pseudobacteriovorax antillogorgiicola]
MSRAHIAIIDPASRVAEIDSFNRLQDLTNAKLTYHLPCLYGLDSLNQLRAHPDALVVLGSGASVHDDLAWQKTFHPWLLQKLNEGVPTLGLCYGHQLLAHLLGGSIGFVSPDQKKLVGMRKIIIKSTIEFSRDQKEGLFIVSHREHVTSLGPQCEIFAWSDDCPVDGFFHTQKPIWGMQSHPEAGPGFVMNQSLPVELDETLFESGQVFLRNFFSHITENYKPPC